MRHLNRWAVAGVLTAIAGILGLFIAATWVPWEDADRLAARLVITGLILIPPTFIAGFLTLGGHR